MIAARVSKARIRAGSLPAFRADRLNAIPQVLFNDCLMEARMPRVFVHDDAYANRVLEHWIKLHRVIQ